MIFYDFEVFKYDWFLVAIEMPSETTHRLHNDENALLKLYNAHKDDIWVGYNSKFYDVYILQGILAGFDPYDINHHIIIEDKAGWSYSKLLKKFPLINYDVQPSPDKSLKQLEAYQGHSIEETEVDFSLDRQLSLEECKQTFDYCYNDVCETINIFAEGYNDFTSIMWLVKNYNFPLSYVSRTKAELSAEILECEKTTFDDEFDLYVLPCVNTGKYALAEKFFLDSRDYTAYSNKYTMNICDVPHILAWGGIHGARKEYHYKIDRNHIMVHVDVESFYPREMIYHGLLTRAAKKPKRFKEIFDERMRLKHAGLKKEQAPFKIVINGTYGISKDRKSKAYDPRNANLVCMNGQLLLIDLLDKLEDGLETFELIQSNTDGIILKINIQEFDRLDDICYEWESRCDMVLGFDYIKEIWQKDVNNYVFVDFDGGVERKGGEVKDHSDIDNDLPIISTAMVEAMIHNKSVRETIMECDDLVQFQRICKVSSKFTGARWYHDNTYDVLTNKVYRVFAVSDERYGKLVKLKGEQEFKFPNTSEHIRFLNNNIQGESAEWVDKEWYIDLAEKRLAKYGL